MIEIRGAKPARRLGLVDHLDDDDPDDDEPRRCGQGRVFRWTFPSNQTA